MIFKLKKKSGRKEFFFLPFSDVAKVPRQKLSNVANVPREKVSNVAHLPR
jgi:hypothetical protein